MKRLALILLLWFQLAGCLALWPWSLSRAVVQTDEEEPAVRIKPPSPVGVSLRNYRTRAITPFEKQFDFNQDGVLQGEEMMYLKRAQLMRAQEKQLRGEP